MARTGSPADLIPRNLRALHGALEHSLTIQVARLQELTDDLVARGSLTRAEADDFLGRLVGSSKAYSEALLQVLDSIMDSATAPVRAAAGLLADTVRQAPGLVPGRVSGRRRPAETTVPRPEPGPPTGYVDPPIPELDSLTVPQVRARLAGLDPAALRSVREREIAGKARKGVLGEIEKLLA